MDTENWQRINMRPVLKVFTAAVKDAGKRKKQ